ncbi:MAG: TetR/AcrR family transcriptional regulator [Crocinitomicaceae bacterium]|nr:TetR/AcrR family transcriptional regulator [Crocinitomicaceae bacterium]MBK9592946.1 TetR/AcrR family transcriptional regulator [Crocinitomicaceae bacterium]
MPKETFIKLSEEKKTRFLNAALTEFAANNFDVASITQIVKNLGIAKGSVYQYFEDKLDLWLYLKTHCEMVKFSYIQNLNRDDFSDFWGYYRQMFKEGIRFDLNEPLCSQFLYRVGFKENSAVVQPHLSSWKKIAFEFFTKLVEQEKKKGNFSKKTSTPSAVHFLISMSLSVGDLMQNMHGVDFDKNLKKGKSLFAKNEKELMKSVDELIDLLQKALKP